MMLVNPWHGCTLVEVSDLIFFCTQKWLLYVEAVHYRCFCVCTMLLVYKDNFLCTRVSFCVQNKKMNFDLLTWLQSLDVCILCKTEFQIVKIFLYKSHKSQKIKICESSHLKERNYTLILNEKSFRKLVRLAIKNVFAFAARGDDGVNCAIYLERDMALYKSRN